MPYPPNEIDRKDIAAIIFIFAAALLARAAYLLDYIKTGIYPLLAYSDGYSYFLWAKDIASGDILGRAVFMKWPLYAYFLGFLFKASGSNVTAVYALQFISGAVNCVMVYFIARVIFNRKAAFLSGICCALYSVFIFYEGLLVYTSLSLFLNSVFFLFVLRARHHPGKRGFFWLGALLGICALTQANIILFGALAILVLLREENKRGRGVLFGAVCFLCGLFIIIAPVTLRNYLVAKDIVPICANIGINFYLGNNPEAGGSFHTPLFLAPNQEDMFRDSRVIAQAEAGRPLKASEVSGYWFNRAVNFIKDEPRAYMRLLFKKTAYLFGPDEPIHDIEYQFIADKIRALKFTFTDLRFILPFSFLGILLGLKRFREAALLYLFLASSALSVAFFFVTTRYRAGMVPLLIVFASYGAFCLWEVLKDKRYLRFGVLLAATILLFVLSNGLLSRKDKISYSEQNNISFHSHLSKALYYNGISDHRNAMAQIEAAYLLNPKSHYCLISYGVIYYNIGDLRMAEEKFREAIKVFPLSVDAYYNLGLLYNKQGRFEEAVKVLSRAVSLDQEDVGAHFELGRAYKGAGRYDEAGHEFSRALDRINRWRSEERALIKEELKDTGR
ncbi:MAG: tetratricopeptide repeat protein [Candidatus Omnitrophota bacterium]|jgi:Flp pilus assembly protein TadD